MNELTTPELQVIDEVGCLQLEDALIEDNGFAIHYCRGPGTEEAILLA